ncbi:MAG: RNA-binding cell elongation regulator Jag/EloR [Fimbriimonadales bacterium]
MNQTTEATGRTLEDAKKAAAEMLGMGVDELDYEVIEESAKGLFAKTNYRVRASAKAAAPVEEPAANPEKPAKPERPARAARPERKAPAAKEKVEGESEEAEVVANDEDGKIAEGILNDVLGLTGLSVSAKFIEASGKYVNIDLSGKDVDVFVGEKAVIDSLQYLTNAMFGRKHPNGTRLTLDAAGHRSARNEALEQLAREVAAAVADRKQEAVLDPLPAHERRIIHNVLREIDEVETYSEGEEPARRIVISPKK